jgi:hypothetical protein
LVESELRGWCGTVRAVQRTRGSGARHAAVEDLAAPGVEGNARLTGLNGMLLVILLAVEGATILRIRQLITVHVYVGVLLVGPLLLKCGSTAYRFLRYYAGARAYRQKGPPQLMLRALGPFVILTTFAVVGTGIGLLALRPGHTGLLLTAHKASFVLWFGVMTIHVLGHIRGAALESWRDLRGSPTDPAVRQRWIRIAVIALALVAGVAAATAIMPEAAPWTRNTVGFRDR